MHADAILLVIRKCFFFHLSRSCRTRPSLDVCLLSCLCLAPPVSLAAPSLSPLEDPELYFFITSRVHFPLDYLILTIGHSKELSPLRYTGGYSRSFISVSFDFAIFRLLRHPVRFFYHPLFLWFVYLFTSAFVTYFYSVYAICLSCAYTHPFFPCERERYTLDDGY